MSESKFWVIATLIIVILAIAAMIGIPQYRVWEQGKKGAAILAHANYSREVAVAEARAKMEAAELLAQAEVTRAKGVAAANEIIGKSLRENEAYLRYLWITEVAGKDTQKEVIYVPTEANIPILEAGRLIPAASR